MSDLKAKIGLTLYAFLCIALGLSLFFAFYFAAGWDDIDKGNSCNCTINYGGHNMSVEDAFERAGEGLTVDQTDEVQVLIERYCK